MPVSPDINPMRVAPSAARRDWPIRQTLDPQGNVPAAWRLLMFQKNSALAQWYRQHQRMRRARARTMVVAMARKLLMSWWRLVRGRG